MKQTLESTNSELLKSPCELAAMLGHLSRDERLRVEGIIIGLGLRNANQLPAAKDNA